MLARSGPLPAEPGWAYELKWDGFRAIVRTGEGFQVRSRRGWNMTPHLPVLRDGRGGVRARRLRQIVVVGAAAGLVLAAGQGAVGAPLRPARVAVDASLTADYRFQNSLVSSVGFHPPDLVDLGGLKNSFV